jgi:hypothetical protein
LRESLIALAAARLAGEGQQTKMELVYQYLRPSLPAADRGRRRALHRHAGRPRPRTQGDDAAVG